MGNTSSSSKTHETRVDQGYLTPHGIYTGPHDWNQHVVGQLILERRLAPFYRPLEEFDNTWDDERILANRRGPEGEPEPPVQESHKHAKAHPRPIKEVQKPSEAQIYRGAVECPICFMYYPPNINYSRCCFQAICSECFVQIKRNEPTPTHLLSEPACCPYCQQENFGVTYNPPPWRTGLGPESAPQRPDLGKSTSTGSDSSRRKSLSHDSPSVITIDQIRPDWEERLAAVKAAVARRANRRIIMRQVGDRLIPVGVTSSRTQLPEGITTVEDIEELMLMEAMRLSLLDQERAPGNSSSADVPVATNGLIPPRSLLSPNIPSPSNPISSSPSETTSDEPSRRRASPSMAALALPLANASNLIAISTAMPSTSAATTSEQPHQPSSSMNPGIVTADAGDVRNRLSSQSSHQRVDSNPPPTTALAAALSANLTANAFLRPSENDSPNATAVHDPPNEPIQLGSSHSTTSEPMLSTPPRKQGGSPLPGNYTGEDSQATHPQKSHPSTVDVSSVMETTHVGH